MMILHGEKVRLRALEPEDLDFLFTTENNTAFWEVSNTQAPFSRFVLKQYLENSHQDIYEAIKDQNPALAKEKMKIHFKTLYEYCASNE